MIPWIQVYSNIVSHPKTARLAEALQISCASVSPSVVAVGILVSIWTWAVQNAYDGDLSDVPPSVIADACRWKKKPQQLWDALVASGYLDSDGKLHDWDEYALLIMDAEDNRKEKTRDRVKRYRERKCNVTVTLQERNGNVTETQCNAPTIPYHTIQENDDDHDDNILSLSCAREGGEKAPKSDAEGVESVDNSVKAQCAELDAAVRRAIKAHWGREADERDLKHGRNELVYFDANTEKMRVYDDAMVDYVFSVSERAGEKAQNWRFVLGVLRKLRERGITDVMDALDYNEKWF